MTEQTYILKEENQKLLKENVFLKRKLEAEQLLHTNLYKEWIELKKIDIVKEAELQRYENTSRHRVSRTTFAFLLIITLSLAGFAIYNLFFQPVS